MILPDNCYAQTGELRVSGRSGTIPSTYPRLGGWAIDPTTNMPFVQDAGVAVPTTSVPGYGGWRFTPDGALYVTFDSLTGPFTWINGFKTRQDGALVVLSRTGVPGVDPAPMGWSADGSTSAALIGGMSFNLPLADAGAGAVNLVPPFSAGSPTSTFTRATTATTVLQNGLVAGVGSGVARSYYDPSSFVTNSLLRSQEFDNASWTKVDTVATANNITAPDGTLTADLLTEGSAGNANLTQAVTATADASYTVSRYVKFGNHAWIRVIVSNGANNFNGFFNIQTGVVGSQAVSGTGVSGSIGITSVGDGWFRCTLSGTVGSGATAISVQTTSATANSNGARVFGGTRFEWGAQFEDRATVAGTYVPTTTTALTVAQTYGGYLAEGQRTNLCLQSEDFATSWGVTDTVVTVNNTTSPDGAVTADLITEGVAGTALIQQGGLTVTADVTCTNSMFLKRGNHDWVRITYRDFATGTNRCDVWFNLLTGAVGTAANVGTGTAAGRIKAYANGWYRCEVSGNIGSGTTNAALGVASASADNNATRVNNGTRFQWGAQLENNVSFASSYIPTTVASVTRNADVLTYPSAGNWSASSGSSYAELWTEWGLAGGPAFPTAIGIQQGVLELGSVSISTQIRINDSTTTATKTGLTDMSTAIRKRASAWGGTTMSATGDGASPQNAAFGGVQSVGAAIGIGCSGPGTASWFGTIKNAQIWTSKLPDATLSAITA